MKLLTQDAVLVCAHELGTVSNQPSQTLVTIASRKVLVETDPENRPIRGCPNAAPPFKPCLHTLKVAVGYSDLVRIQGKRACLDSVTGLTDGTPPGIVKYKVRSPGQSFVAEGE